MAANLDLLHCIVSWERRNRFNILIAAKYYPEWCILPLSGSKVEFAISSPTYIEVKNVIDLLALDRSKIGNVFVKKLTLTTMMCVSQKC